MKQVVLRPTAHDFDSGWAYTGECHVYRLESNDKSEEDARYLARTPLWVYDEIPDSVDEWIKSSWFFAVPLVEIGSYDALRAQITEPLRELLMENRPPEEVFRGRRAIPAGREMSRGHADDQRERNTV